MMNFKKEIIKTILRIIFVGIMVYHAYFETGTYTVIVLGIFMLDSEMNYWLIKLDSNKTAIMKEFVVKSFRNREDKNE